MEYGIRQALDEITLVVFTTLGPAGTLAFVLTGLFAAFGALATDERRRVGHCLVVPLVVAMVGLVASSTHLGTPSNALFVLCGIGRSPLSNEVASGVLFLAMAALSWFASYFMRDRPLVRKLWMTATALVGLLFMTMISLAYNVDTIATWSSSYVPAIQWALACVLGPFVVLLTLRWAEVERQARFEKAVTALAGLAFVVSLVLLVLQDAELPTLANSWTTAADLVPLYGWAILAYAMLEVAAFCLTAPIGFLRARMKPMPLVACVVAAAGVFVLRFFFYVMRMTVGM